MALRQVERYGAEKTILMAGQSVPLYLSSDSGPAKWVLQLHEVIPYLQFLGSKLVPMRSYERLRHRAEWKS